MLQFIFCFQPQNVTVNLEQQIILHRNKSQMNPGNILMKNFFDVMNLSLFLIKFRWPSSKASPVF